MATITVLNTNDSGAGSLRQAIADASAGDTIVFDSTLAGGTILLESEILISKALTITGPVDNDGAPDLTLDGGTSNSRSGCRCVHVTASATINNLVIANGYLSTANAPQYGACVFFDYSSAHSSAGTLSNCEVCGGAFNGSYSIINRGYGIYIAAQHGTINLTDCKFTGVEGNTSGYSIYGGFRGLFYAESATINVTRCINDVSRYVDENNNEFFCFYFVDCTISMTDVGSITRGTFIAGGSLSINGLSTSRPFSVFGFIAEEENLGVSSFAVSGYNFLGELFGAPAYDDGVDYDPGMFGAITGSGYIAGYNVSDWTGLPETITPLVVPANPEAHDFSGDEHGLTWVQNGQVLLEKQVNGAWQKIDVIPYTPFVDPDDPFSDYGDLIYEPPRSYPPYVPDPMHPSEDDETSPSAPLVPNPEGPGTVPYTVNYNPTVYPIETTETTTYRIWDGVNFLTYTVEVEEPEPEPEPEPPEPVAVRPGRRVSAQLQMTYENENESAIPAGTPVQIGSAFGVAEVAIPAGATGVISILGTWIFPCANTTVANIGDVACWDDTNKVITTAPSGSSAGLTTEYNAISESGGTVTFSVADSTGWAVGDLFHIDDDEWTLEVTATTATTIKGQYVVQPQGYLEPDTGTLVQEVETPDVLPVGAFVNAVSSGETEATVMIYPAAPVNGESSSSEESGGGD